eukprot:TRINITY_DN1515_c0_g1_i2.p1 TRINITY_DN1515_c0_g1~~TRINITY_DN1515_c0_g1_i2.p1  ORF type:complete len:332 (-),score=61.52 TRINITY_DN1515_c0_g1_i2:95-1090(-)
MKSNNCTGTHVRQEEAYIFALSFVAFVYFILDIYCIFNCFRVFSSNNNNNGDINNKEYLHHHHQHNQQRASSSFSASSSNNIGRKLWGRMFYPLSVVACALRVVYMVELCLWEKNLINLPVQVSSVLSYAPSIIFFIAYLIILLRWVQTYHKTIQRPIRARRLRFVFLVILFSLVSAATILFGLDFATEMKYCQIDVNATKIERFLSIFTASIYFITSVAFLIYALLLRNKMRKIAYLPNTQKSKIIMNRVNALTYLIVSVFVIRCGIVAAYSTVTPVKYKAGWWVVDPIYYVVLEALPLVFMIKILKDSNGRGAETAPLLASHHPASQHP